MLVAAISCKQQSQNVNTTYTEPSDPKPFDTIGWNNVPAGIIASFGSINTRYGRSSKPKLEVNDSWEGTAWKGERVNAQLVLWTVEKLTQVNCEVSNLMDEGGNSISSKNINTFFVRYVITDEFGKSSCDRRKTTDYDSSIVADALDPIPYFDIKEKTTRPLWITIDVPKDAIASTYSGNITINSENQEKVVLKVKLKVQDIVLPEPKEWSFHLDLWQNPFAVARYHKVELWSPEHFKLLRPLLKMLANAGQKCVTASIMNRPWGGQTFDEFKSLIEWKKNADGSWSFDYTLFDNWVGFAMDCGIDDQINCYTMIPWGNQFSYFDESLNKDTVVTAIPGTEAYKQIWTPFLQHFTKHLKEKNWLNIATIAMDERALEDMNKMIAFVHTTAPGLKITLAGDFYEEISNDIYDLCVASQHVVAHEEIEKRKMQGLHTTYYTCCTEPYPNNFTFSPPAEGVYQGWYAAAKGYSGFLRWAYNSWVKDPLIDSRFRAWPGGDTYLVYPNAMSSIRFERLREGIQDYEKIRIVRNMLLEENSDKGDLKLHQLDEFLAQFEINQLKDTPAEVIVNQGKQILNLLSSGFE